MPGGVGEDLDVPSPIGSWCFEPAGQLGWEVFHEFVCCCYEHVQQFSLMVVTDYYFLTFRVLAHLLS